MNKPHVRHTATTLPSGLIRTASITVQPDGTSKTGVHVTELQPADWRLVFLNQCPPERLKVTFCVELDGVILQEVQS